MTTYKSAGSSASEGKHVTKRTFTLAPKKLKTVGLGKFPTTADPRYQVTGTPNLDELLVVATEKMPIPADPRHYMLFYMIENYSNVPCEVTVQYVGEGGKHGS